MFFSNTVSPADKEYHLYQDKQRGDSQDHIIKMPDDTASTSEEEGEEKFLPEPFGPFADKLVRKQFIRKVYSILSVQLMSTVIMGVVFMAT